MDFVPLARSYVQEAYPTLASTYAFPLPGVVVTLDDLVDFMGTVEEAVFAAADRGFKQRANLNATQAAGYDALRNVWHAAQLKVYRLARTIIENTFPQSVSQSLVGGIAYPGWLPRRDVPPAAPMTLTPDMRDAQGKRLGIWSATTRWLAQVHARYANTTFSLDGAANDAREALGDLDAAGMAARALTERLGRALAGLGDAATNTGIVPPAMREKVHATAEQLQAMRDRAIDRELLRAGSSYTWLYITLGAVGTIGLFWLLLRKPATRSHGVSRIRGVGEATRLTSLRDKVPSRYGLEVR